MSSSDQPLGASAGARSLLLAFCAESGAPPPSHPAVVSNDVLVRAVQQKVDAALTARVCGSPAEHGSPTAQWWHQYIVEPGKFADLKVHLEDNADYDGVALVWGIGNKQSSALECAEQCKNHQPGAVAGPFSALPCNAFVWCGSETCFEPDAHHHTRGDCWLKFTEGPASPEVNMRGRLDEAYKLRHPSAPDIVQWVAGVLLPEGVELKNGTWSPRFSW